MAEDFQKEEYWADAEPPTGAQSLAPDAASAPHTQDSYWDDAKAVEAPHNIVFDQDNDRTVALPQTLNADESQFLIKRDADEIKTFFAMEDVGGFEAVGRGIDSFFLSDLPQSALGLAKEGTELAPARQKETSTSVGSFRDKYGWLGGKVNDWLAKPETAQKVDRLIERNKQYVAEYAPLKTSITGRPESDADGNLIKEKQDLSRPENDPLGGFMFDLGKGTGSLVTSVGIAALTRNPLTAATFFGAMQKSQVYQEARAAGKTPEQASDISSVAGAVEGALEFVGLDYFMKALKGNSAVKNFVKGAFVEGIQEGSQGAGEEVVTQVSGIRDKTIKQTIEDILYQAALGAIIGGPVAGLGASVKTEAINKGIPEATAEKMAQYVEKNVSKATQNMTEFIDKELAPIAADEKSAQEFITLMQDFGNDKELVNPDSLDAETRKVFDQYTKMFDESMRNTPDIQAAKKTFYDRAVASGVDQEQAEMSSQLIGARADAASRALGITPQQWLESKKLSIQVEGNNTQPAAPVSLKEDPNVMEAQQISEFLNSKKKAGRFNRNDANSVQRSLGLTQRPLSVLQYIRSIGGISTGMTSEELGNVKAANKDRGKSTSKASLASGELRRAFDGKKGLGRYIKEDGLGIDEIYTRLVDAGYIEKQSGDGTEEDGTQAVLELIEREANGEKVYTAQVERDIDASSDTTDQNIDYLHSLGIDKNSSIEEIASVLAGRDTQMQQSEDDEIPMFFQDDAYKNDGSVKTSSPEFKAWFGNSKVVDADGTPLVVYHGTKEAFEAFDLNKLGRNGMALGAGFYFSNSKDLAKGYGETLEVYLSAQNPTLSIEKKTITRAQAKKIVAALEKIEPDFLSNYGDISYEGHSKVFNAAIEDIFDTSKNDADVITTMINVGGIDRDDVMRAVIKATGKDGFVVHAGIAAMGAGENDNVYTVLLPTQIKSVSNRGTFDPNDARILYQDGGGISSKERAAARREFVKYSRVKKVVYHATSADFESFDTSKGDLGAHFGDVDQANKAAERGRGASPDTGPNIMPVYIDLRNPLRLKDTGSFHAWAIADQLAKKKIISKDEAERMEKEGWKEQVKNNGIVRKILKDKGYDGVIYKNEHEGDGDSYIAFDPQQIKSVNNIGTFDREDSRTLYQSAYHGSPHRFDKFTLDHIGSGEGAQAYGWGLYFAGKREVAEYYRKTLGVKEMKIDGKKFVPSNYRINEIVGESGSNQDRMYFELNKYIKENAGNPYAGLDDAKRIVDAIDAEKFEPNAQGQLYEVQIPEDDVLLHWDKPLSEQPESVKTAINSLIKESEYGSARIEFDGHDVSGWKASPQERLETLKGDAFYLQLAGIIKRVNKLEDTNLAREAASKYLNDLGIKGIKYLDGSSRKDGEGSHNYVIFDDSAIETLQTFYQDGKNKPRGSIQFGKDRNLISLFKNANPSTLLHELGHLFLRDMRDVASQTTRPRVKADYRAVQKWLGASGDTLTVKQEEKFARGFEQYLREGKAPRPELQSAFDRFKEWLSAIYKSVKDLNVQLTPEIRQVFDRMLGADYAQAETLNQQQAERDIEEDYAIKRKLRKETKKFFPDTVALFRDASDLAADAFVPISTRLGTIDAGLKHAVRRFTFDTGLHTHEDRVKVKPFVEAASNMEVDDYLDLDTALKNRDNDKVDFLLDKYDMQESFKGVREVLDSLYEQAQDVGIDMNYIDDYFPRAVKSGMAAEYIAAMQGKEVWSEIELALDEVDPDATFTPEEKAAFVNNYLRGFNSAAINLSAPSFSKERTVDYVEPEFDKYYEDSMPTLMSYISGVRHGIESRKMFGKSEKETEANIGRYVLNLIEEGSIKASQELELRKLLKAIVDPTGTRGIVSWAKNVSYIYTMGNPLSAITQVQDLAFSLYKNGFYRTGRGLVRSLSGNQVLKKEDLGIDNVLQEFEDSSRASRAVKKIFDVVGLSFMDNVGKEVYIDAAYSRIVSANKKNSKEFNNALNDVFADESPQVKEDIANGVMSENVKYLLFSELSDIQPISLAEMPVGYLRGGNGRVWYMLKSYTIKQIDIYRNEIFANLTGAKKIATGNVKDLEIQDAKNAAAALKNLVQLGAALVMMGMGSDALKDLLLGRPIEVTELMMDNMLKLTGLTKYQIYKGKKDGYSTAFFVSLAVPPIIEPLADAYKDISAIVLGKEDKRSGKVVKKDVSDSELLGKVPVIGKFYYWWWGGGRTKLEKDAKKDKD